jgi:hypothetical protein
MTDQSAMTDTNETRDPVVSADPATRAERSDLLPREGPQDFSDPNRRRENSEDTEDNPRRHGPVNMRDADEDRRRQEKRNQQGPSGPNIRSGK